MVRYFGLPLAKIASPASHLRSTLFIGKEYLQREEAAALGEEGPQAVPFLLPLLSTYSLELEVALQA
jgi:hypothetical protein